MRRDSVSPSSGSFSVKVASTPHDIRMIELVDWGEKEPLCVELDELCDKILAGIFNFFE